MAHKNVKMKISDNSSEGIKQLKEYIQAGNRLSAACKKVKEALNKFDEVEIEVKYLQPVKHDLRP